MSTGFQFFLGCLASIGVILYGWGQYRNGKSSAAQRSAQEASDTVALLKTRTDTLEKQLSEQAKQLHDYEIQMAKYEEALKHKDALIEQYFKIITNRNPDLEKTLEEVVKFLKALNEKIGDAATISVS
jgi:predicted RNase H-like nuclease (RuvC/YqgF family)